MQNLKSLFSLFIFIFLVGCSAVKLPKVDSYELSNANKHCRASSRSKTRNSLTVSSPSASPGYGTTSMAYIMTPYQLSYFTRSRWVAPPQQMLLPIVVQAIRAKGYYKAVIPAPQIARTAYRLDLNLLVLEQDFLLPKSRERVRVQATLLDNRSNQVVASRCFSALITTKTNTPYGGVLAANQAVSGIAHSIANWSVRNSRSSVGK